jgi:hypothetical protein
MHVQRHSPVAAAVERGNAEVHARGPACTCGGRSHPCYGTRASFKGWLEVQPHLDSLGQEHVPNTQQVVEGQHEREERQEPLCGVSRRLHGLSLQQLPQPRHLILDQPLQLRSTDASSGGVGQTPATKSREPHERKGPLRDVAAGQMDRRTDRQPDRPSCQSNTHLTEFTVFNDRIEAIECSMCRQGNRVPGVAPPHPRSPRMCFRIDEGRRGGNACTNHHTRPSAPQPSCVHATLAVGDGNGSVGA